MFEFTKDDLKSNQHGFISPGQNTWLQSVVTGTRRSSHATARIAVGFLFFGWGLILALYLQNEETRTAFFSNPYHPLIFLGVVPLVLAVIALGLFVARRQADKLLDAKLQVAEGNVNFDSEYSSESALISYFVDVGDERFSFSEDMSQIFSEGARYRVYFCKSGPHQFIFSYEKRPVDANL